MTTPRVTVPVEPEYTATEYLRLIAEGWEVIESTGSQMTIQNPEDDGPQELVIDVDLLSAAPAPEGGEVDWSYDLTLCPRNEPFLIAYDDGDVRMGHYLDNSKSSVPWEGIRPLFVAERWDAKIIAWAKRPALATREEAPADHHERNLSMTNDELIEQALSSPPLEAPAEAPMTEAEVRQWIDACNHEPARQVLRDYLALRAQPPAREDTQPVACRFCDGAGWEDDQNWEPRYVDVPQEREKGDGLIRCGHCLGDGVDPSPATHPAPDALRVALPDPLFIDTVQRMLARFDRAKGKGGYPTANERWAMRECVATLVALQANQKGGA